MFDMSHAIYEGLLLYPYTCYRRKKNGHEGSRIFSPQICVILDTRVIIMFRMCGNIMATRQSLEISFCFGVGAVDQCQETS